MLFSSDCSKLTDALVKVQAEIKNPANTVINPYFKAKYAPLPDILNLIRPILAKHGLSVVQEATGDGEVVSIITTVFHSSGQWMNLEPLTLKPEKNTPQGSGSAITYGRRYTLTALLGISGEEDDDGNYSSGAGNNAKPTQKKSPPKKEPTKKTPKPSTASESGSQSIQEGQLKAIWAVGDRKGLNEEQIRSLVYQVAERESLKELTFGEASDVIKELNALKSQD